ncbi:hypothetical protein CC117_15755 [Parafrankia colletiae]|uniref:Secreted protein n=2 Tax=Parafrankia colletiae TaxID=573497 RepID=A0A1S1R100_9ACTN|nr:hypothetical protein [Frankia sp. Cpl3]OHV38384.1 hypothetical protein CC117_15755 [Parafrankia colletiae]
MRITRMLAATAGVLGAALIAVAAPASAATTPTPDVPTTTTSVSPTTTPSTGILVETSTAPSGTPTADPSASADPSATPSVDPSASPSASTDPSATPTDTAPESASPTPTEGTGDPILDGFLSLLPFKVPLDKEIDGIEDFDANPLLLTYTCGDSGPDWVLRNSGDKALGFGWFDTSLGAGISEIGPGATLNLTSHAMAVIASPWDSESGYLLVTVPTVGVSDCEDTAPPATAPVALPIAVPATSSVVHAEPYYTG